MELSATDFVGSVLGVKIKLILGSSKWLAFDFFTMLTAE